MSTRKQKIQHFADKTNYNLYCVNFHGSSLNSIKNEFKRQVQTGLRQTVFILDKDDVENELNNTKPSNNKIQKEFHENYDNHLMNVILQYIQGFRKEYEFVAKKISEELKFDFNQYWLKELEDKESKKTNFSTKPNNFVENDVKKNKNTKKTNEILSTSNDENNVICSVKIESRKHNRIGQPELLSKRKYVSDDPTVGQLYIIIIGQMNDNFYSDLLRRDQPLQAIINYLPNASYYDIELSNSKLQNFIMETRKLINSTWLDLRQQDIMKQVGFFTYDLPILSKCLAAKYAREIFDQLTWAIYDIKVLQQQYELYYYKTFQEIDVGIPSSADLTQLYYKAESLKIQGHYQTNSLPICSPDSATITMYLNGLLNICGLSEEIENKSSRNTFSSIMKIRDRIVVDENNKLLYNMLLYADQTIFKNIYLSCLDYNIFKKYVLSSYLRKDAATSNTSDNEGVKSLSLPKYVKYYANTDCCLQRISELLQEYDNYQINESATGYKLYSFTRMHNIIIEDEHMVVIPTRLCFRDFTLYQKEEFLNNLKIFTANRTEEKDHNELEHVDIDDNNFLRPNSLKALKLGSEKNNDLSKNTNKLNIKSSIDTSQKLAAEVMGLPSNHHLLNGYNLEDVRQEVKIKTSKFYFNNGCIQLYEESWCCQDMNKELIVSLNNNYIFFNKSRLQHEVTLNNIRLTTKNNINIRILNDKDEPSKIIMNYPNGLNIYHHNMHCEQIWCCEQTPKDEQRRICTPYGAVIVFFKTENIILVMRYNGEVYKLYQHELTEEDKELLNGVSQNLEQISEMIDVQKDVHNKIESRSSDESVKILNSSTASSITNHLKSSIDNELLFINYISSVYKLNYSHLLVTTSQGKCFNLTQRKKIFEGSHCDISEWQDYFANEVYCQRSDGVRMIWTKDSLKCYHKDGTVLTTMTEEGLESAEINQFESQISESSSHNKNSEKESYTQRHEYEQNMDITISRLNSNESLTKKQGVKQLSTHLQLQHSCTSNYLLAEYVEEYIPEDFISYTCNSCLLQHHFYADVYILWQTLNLSNLSVRVEINGIDGIRIYSHPVELVSEFKFMKLKGELDLKYYAVTEGEHGNEVILNVWIDENLHMKMDKNGCEIFAKLECSDVDESKMAFDSLIWRLKYTDGLNDVFKYLISEITNIKKYKDRKTEVLHFLHKIYNEGKHKGFEFINSLPLLSNYSCELSNCIINANPLKSVNELMTNHFEWYEADMNKFSRYQKYQNKMSPNSRQEISKVLSSNVYVKIPNLLQNIADIPKWLEPFEHINFKKLRNKMKDLIDLQLQPQLELNLTMLYSRKNWIIRQKEFKKRKFGEKQRLGLYHAMIKHSKYPNYWKFKYVYSGHVSSIDFYDFMQFK